MRTKMSGRKIRTLRNNGGKPPTASEMDMSEANARLRNSAAQQRLEEKLGMLCLKERHSERRLEKKTEDLLQALHNVKLGRKKEIHILEKAQLRPRSNSIQGPQPRTSLMEELKEESQLGEKFNAPFMRDRHLFKLPRITTARGKRPLRSALERRRFSENDALVVSLQKFHAMQAEKLQHLQKTTSECDSSNLMSGSVALDDLPPMPRPPARTRSGSCFGRLFVTPNEKFNDGGTHGTHNKEENHQAVKIYGKLVENQNSVMAQENNTIENGYKAKLRKVFSVPNSKTFFRSVPEIKPQRNDVNNNNGDEKDGEVSFGSSSANLQSNTQSVTDIPSIVLTVPEDTPPLTSSPIGANNWTNPAVATDREIISMDNLDIPNSEWRRKKRLREARKKTNAVLPATFAALSQACQGRRFSSPDASQEAAIAHRNFLSKLNERRRSEESDLKEKVQLFLKKTESFAALKEKSDEDINKTLEE